MKTLHFVANRNYAQATACRRDVTPRMDVTDDRHALETSGRACAQCCNTLDPPRLEAFVPMEFGGLDSTHPEEQHMLVKTGDKVHRGVAVMAKVADAVDTGNERHVQTIVNTLTPQEREGLRELKTFLNIFAGVLKL